MDTTLETVSSVAEKEIQKLIRDFRMTEEQARNFLFSEYKKYLASPTDPRD